MWSMSPFDLEQASNIARNKHLLATLELQQGSSTAIIPTSRPKPKPKPRHADPAGSTPDARSTRSLTRNQAVPTFTPPVSASHREASSPPRNLCLPTPVPALAPVPSSPAGTNNLPATQPQSIQQAESQDILGYQHQAERDVLHIRPVIEDRWPDWLRTHYMWLVTATDCVPLLERQR